MQLAVAAYEKASMTLMISPVRLSARGREFLAGNYRDAFACGFGQLPDFREFVGKDAVSVVCNQNQASVGEVDGLGAGHQRAGLMGEFFIDGTDVDSADQIHEFGGRPPVAPSLGEDGGTGS